MALEDKLEVEISSSGNRECQFKIYLNSQWYFYCGL